MAKTQGYGQKTKEECQLKKVRRRHRDGQVGQLGVETLAHFQGKDEIRVHMDLSADAGAAVDPLGGILPELVSVGEEPVSPVVFRAELPGDGGHVKEGIDNQVEVLLEQIELQDFGAELEVSPGIARGHQPVVLVPPDGVAAS